MSESKYDDRPFGYIMSLPPKKKNSEMDMDKDKFSIIQNFFNNPKNQLLYPHIMREIDGFLNTRDIFNLENMADILSLSIINLRDMNERIGKQEEENQEMKMLEKAKKRADMSNVAQVAINLFDRMSRPTSPSSPITPKSPDLYNASPRKSPSESRKSPSPENYYYINPISKIKSIPEEKELSLSRDNFSSTDLGEMIEQNNKKRLSYPSNSPVLVASPEARSPVVKQRSPLQRLSLFLKGSPKHKRPRRHL